jgi:hypothetical protein
MKEKTDLREMDNDPDVWRMRAEASDKNAERERSHAEFCREKERELRAKASK